MVGVTWKGSRSRSFSSAGPGGVRAASQPPNASQEPPQPPRPVVSFKDKQSYQELFKPLPKPEPIPDLKIVQIDCKSWNQLQKEREEIVQREIDRTRMEAESMFNRVKSDDRKRCDLIKQEQDRITQEQIAREQILNKEREERRKKDEQRKEEIRRQEEILANSRKVRSKTVDIGEHRGSFSGGGIRVYHYKDEVVPEIVKQTRQEEMRRKNSVIGLINAENDDHQTNGATNGFNGATNGVNGATNGFNGVNGDANGVSSNGINEFKPRLEETLKQEYPKQVRNQASMLPPRPVKEMAMPSNRQFQNGVDSAFMANGGASENGHMGPTNIYKSVMNGKGFY